MRPTAGFRGGFEHGGYLWIHIDGQPFLHDELLISLVHHLRDPGHKDVLQNGGADICNPLLWHLGDLARIWEVVANLLVWSHKIRDVLDSEVFVLWDGDVPYVFPVDLLLLSADEIFQEVDRYLFYKICRGQPISRIRIRKLKELTISWEVDSTIHSTEVVALSLATVLGCEGRG